MAESGEREEALGVDDFQKILEVLKINLPEGSLNEEIITSSRHSNFIDDAEAITKDLETGQIQVALKPRLACGKVSEVMRLRQEKNVQEITRVIFFKPRKHSEKTLKQRWEQRISNVSCELKIKDTFQENPKWDQAIEGDNVRTETEMRCLKFQIDHSERKRKIENGFVSCSPACPVEFSCSRISAACSEGTSQTMEENLFTLPKDVQLNLTHQDYYQTLAHQYLLEKVQEPTLSAVLVITEHLDNDEDLMDEDGNFYYGKVSEDTKELEDLNNFCLKEVMPRFLAVLNLIFEKNKIEPLSATEYQEIILNILRRNLPRDVLTPEVETSFLTDIINAEATVHLVGGKLQNAPSHPQYDQTQDSIHIWQKVQNTPVSMEIRIAKDQKKQTFEVKDLQNKFHLMGHQHKHQQGEEDQAQIDEDLQNTNQKKDVSQGNEIHHCDQNHKEHQDEEDQALHNQGHSDQTGQKDQAQIYKDLQNRKEQEGQINQHDPKPEIHQNEKGQLNQNDDSHKTKEKTNEQNQQGCNDQKEDINQGNDSHHCNQNPGKHQGGRDQKGPKEQQDPKVQCGQEKKRRKQDVQKAIGQTNQQGPGDEKENVNQEDQKPKGRQVQTDQEDKMKQCDQKHHQSYRVQKKSRRGKDQEDEDDEEEEEEEEEEKEYQQFYDDHEVLDGNFYYIYVSGDTSRIEELNNYCRSESLPRFLAVLNLIFEKVD